LRVVSENKRVWWIIRNSLTLPIKYRRDSKEEIEVNALVVVATLCHIIKGDRILLKRAARGISKGKWNAPGGKLTDTETPLDNVRREVLEETRLKVRNMIYHGIMEYFMWGKKTLHTRAYLFSTHSFQGKYGSTAEGRLRWFNRHNLPFDQMWPDDEYWIHLALMGSRFNGKFYFDNTNAKVLRYSITSREANDSEALRRAITPRS
jgi:8-oxo-dGTP pyrophosphatase MutT (NUDIX family)